MQNNRNFEPVDQSHTDLIFFNYNSVVEHSLAFPGPANINISEERFDLFYYEIVHIHGL